MFTLPAYCPEKASYQATFWPGNGSISMCSLNTISVTILASYLTISGLRLSWMYRRYGVLRQSSSDDPSSNAALYRVRMFLTYLLAVDSIFQFVVETHFMYNDQIFLYSIVSNLLYILMFLYSARLIRLERYYVLPHTLVRSGRSSTLLVFWMLVFAVENLAVINYWKIYRTKAQITDGLIILFLLTKYVVSTALFLSELWTSRISSKNRFRFWGLLYKLSPDKDTKADDECTSTWRDAWAKIKFIAPYLWPRSNFDLQLWIFAWIGVLVIARLMKVLIPMYSKKIVDSLSTSPLEFRWDYLVIGALIGFSYNELLHKLEYRLWSRIEEHTNTKVKVDMFSHVHRLSLSWHLSRKTGKVLRVMDRGTSRMTTLLSSLLEIIFDISIVNVYFFSSLGVKFTLILFLTAVIYIPWTLFVNEYVTKEDEEMNQAEDRKEDMCVDSLLNFETVKYYGNENHEVEMYKKLITNRYDAKHRFVSSSDIQDVGQNFITSLALLCGSLWCVYDITVLKTLTAGDYVLYTIYFEELLYPVRSFGYYYSTVGKALVEIETIYSLLGEEPAIKDLPGAPPIHVSEGAVEFRDVCFSYLPEKPILRNVSFTVQPGKTLALVGPSGGGKTTIIRLLFRFYEVDSGSIFIDDQNIRTVTQESLRKAIGVVPQDTVLFNDTIKYNIQYGRIEASELEVIEAAKNADIHDRILTFPKSYETQVGERGLRLSGGEKQRVAIARTFLKSPKIVLLDEATSSLDTLSERNIQSALTKVSAERTTIIVAHRLSTIIHADEILVVKDGQICERGTHQELVDENGFYATMWQQQLSNDKIVDTIPSDTINEGSVL